MINIETAINSILFPSAVVLSMVVNGGQKPEEQPKNMQFEIEAAEVDRAQVLKKFFERYDSPLVNYADTFVKVADAYGIDYTLLPAISCMESTCGKFMPADSNNAFGWGVYGGTYIKFETHDEAIETVGEGLNENYFSKGWDTIDEIAPIYTPPNSTHWKSGVKYFTNQINEIAKDSTSS